jgi:hypothetical protein
MSKNVIVDAKVLKKERENLVSYLESKINTLIISRDNELELEEISTKNVKDLIKGFLYHNNLSELYKVISEGDKLKIIEIHKKSRKTEKRTYGTTPFETLPYYYPENPIPEPKKK